VLVLDRDPEDPKWIIATVSMAADVRSAALDAAGGYTGWQAVAEWVAATVGRPVALVPVYGALAWRVDEGARRSIGRTVGSRTLPGYHASA
jgi:hypothetical protein